MVRGILATRQRHLQADGKMGRMPSGPTTHFLDPSALTQCLVHRRSQRLSHKPQRIQKIALPEPFGQPAASGDRARRRIPGCSCNSAKPRAAGREPCLGPLVDLLHQRLCSNLPQNSTIPQSAGTAHRDRTTVMWVAATPLTANALLTGLPFIRVAEHNSGSGCPSRNAP